MKYFIMTIWAAMMLFMVGCSQEEITSSSEENAEIIPVKIALGGDLIQVEESPLSRAETESRDLYGIQVYKDGSCFAYGMFDKTEQININLLAGGTYKFVCTAIKDGKDLVRKGYYGYQQPFIGDENFVNYFMYSNGHYFDNLAGNGVAISGEGYTVRLCKAVNRFYGELDGYIPSVNGVVNLELKRVSFGIKVKVSNITDGDVSVKCYNDYNTFVDVSGLTSNYESEGALFSMANVYDAWQYASNYLENITMVVTWNRGVGVTQSWTKTIQVKRNVMNTIRIKLGADDSDIGVGVTPEGGEMGDDEEEIPLG